VDILDGTIRHEQAMLMFKILPIPWSRARLLFHERHICRVNPFEIAPTVGTG